MRCICAFPAVSALAPNVNLSEREFTNVQILKPTLPSSLDGKEEKKCSVLHPLIIYLPMHAFPTTAASTNQTKLSLTRSCLQQSSAPDSAAAAVPLPLLPPPPSTSTTNSAPRARRQFAARLALQHKRQQQGSEAENSSASPTSTEDHAASSTADRASPISSPTSSRGAADGADDPFAALDDRRATAKSVRSLFSSSLSGTKSHDGGRSGFDDDEEDDDDEDERDESSTSGSDDSDEERMQQVLEATTSRERRPLEVDDEDDNVDIEDEEDEWGDFEVSIAGPTSEQYKVGEGTRADANSSDEESGPKPEAKEVKVVERENGPLEEEEDEEDGEALVEIAMPKKEAS